MSQRSIHRLILDQPPSCISFAPRASWGVIGTYLLHPRDDGGDDEPRPQKRTGSLDIFAVKEDEM